MSNTAITPNLQVTSASSQPATLVHNSNRTYSPALGRFLQPDPLASGQTLADGLGTAGSRPSLDITSFDLAAHFTDGMNRFTSRRNDPVVLRDASGLFSMFSQALGTSLSMYGTANDMASTGVDGVSAGMTLTSMIQDYAFDQMLLFEAILDWSTPDDFFRPYDPSAGTPMVGQDPDTWAMGARLHPFRARLGFHMHHIVSHYGKAGKRFKELLRKHDIDFDIHSMGNLMEVAKIHHNGRHTNWYHDMVYGRLEKAVKGKSGAPAYRALVRELDKLKVEIQLDPGLLRRNPVRPR